MMNDTTEKRLISVDDAMDAFTDECKGYEFGDFFSLHDVDTILDSIPTVDAVPVDDIILHHVLIDNEGVPEVKLQIGDRYFILHTDPVDVREVVHGRWDHNGNCSACNKNIYNDIDADMWACYEPPYCPNCGAKMDGEQNG